MELKLRAKTGEAAIGQDILSSSLTGGFNRTQTNYTTVNMQAQLSFLNFSEFTRSGSTIIEAIHVGIVADESKDTVTTYLMQFPGPFTQMIYDPDIGVVLGSSSSRDGSGGCPVLKTDSIDHS